MTDNRLKGIKSLTCGIQSVIVELIHAVESSSGHEAARGAIVAEYERYMADEEDGDHIGCLCTMAEIAEKALKVTLAPSGSPAGAAFSGCEYIEKWRCMKVRRTTCPHHEVCPYPTAAPGVEALLAKQDAASEVAP